MAKQEPDFAEHAEPYQRMDFLDDDCVPQGLAVLPDRSLLIGAYKEDSASCLFRIDPDGVETRFTLKEQDGKPHKGHMGGLALGAENLWIASSDCLLHVPLELLRGDATSVRATQMWELPHKTSIATFYDEHVYVGEFKKDSQPMLYKYSEVTLLIGVVESVANYPLLIKAQGIAISPEGVYVACSYGPKRSKLYFAENLSSLGSAKLIGRLPAGAEGIAYLTNDGALAVAFESGADPYELKWRLQFWEDATITDWGWIYRT
jgi:hypothetical protein